MTELLQHATDDQIALAFCFGALLISGTVMYFSYHIGQMTNRNHAQRGDLFRSQSLQVQPVPVSKDRAA